MKLKNTFRILLICILLLLLTDVFARAGGAHSGGGGHVGGYGGHVGSHGYTNSFNRDYNTNAFALYEMLIIGFLLVICVVLSVIPVLIKLKSFSAAKIITRAANKDSLWKVDTLKTHTEKTFFKMQEAWQNRNMDRIRNRFITEELHEHYRPQLTKMRLQQHKNILSHITITAITIIGCEDFTDDSKDRYVAYIKGNMLDYVIHERSRKILINPEKMLGAFADTYHFVRNNNLWLLEKIDNTVSVLDVIQTKNYIQHT